MFCHHCGNKLPAQTKFCPHCGTGIGSNTVPTNSAPQAAVQTSGYPVTSVGLRFANFILDRVIFFILLGVLGYIGSLFLKDNDTLSGLFVLIYLVGYFIFFEAIWQRTPAKWITKTKVVMQDGSKPDFWHIVGRSFARYIPFEPFSYLAGPVGWHDSLSKTLVVPAHYTPEQVKQIDTTQRSKTSTPIIILIAVVVGIAVIGLLSSVVLLALNSAREKSRDAKRVADVRQVASALELFYNDYSRYPHSLSELPPKYISVIPEAPTPADGGCTPEQNRYDYTYLSDSSYMVTFCLGAETATLSAGVHTLNPQGIDAAQSYNPPSNSDQPLQVADKPNTNDAVATADYQEGYKGGYADGRAQSGQFGDNYSPPATKDRRINYVVGYLEGFLTGCDEGGYDCSQVENYLREQLRDDGYDDTQVQ